MPDLLIRLGAVRGKFGMLSIFAPDGTRAQPDTRVTALQLRAVQQAGPGYTLAHAAIGVTRRVFEERRWMLLGYDHDVGDYDRGDDGTLRIKTREEWVNGRYVDYGVQVLPGETVARAPQRGVAPSLWPVVGTIESGGTILRTP